MKITTESTKKGRCAIFGDGEFLTSVTYDMWYTLGVNEGDEMSADEVEELLFQISNRLCYSSAIRILTMRANSEFELRQKLSKKFDERSIDYAVDRCRELMFLDDRDFAERLGEELLEKKHYGKSRIRAELQKKGISREIIDDVLEEMPDEQTADALRELVEQKYADVDFSDKKQRDKTVAALVRRGYGFDEIRRVIGRGQIDCEDC